VGGRRGGGGVLGGGGGIVWMGVGGESGGGLGGCCGDGATVVPYLEWVKREVHFEQEAAAQVIHIAGLSAPRVEPLARGLRG